MMITTHICLADVCQSIDREKRERPTDRSIDRLTDQRARASIAFITLDYMFFIVFFCSDDIEYSSIFITFYD